MYVLENTNIFQVNMRRPTHYLFKIVIRRCYERNFVSVSLNSNQFSTTYNFTTINTTFHSLQCSSILILVRTINTIKILYLKLLRSYKDPTYNPNITLTVHASCRFILFVRPKHSYSYIKHQVNIVIFFNTSSTDEQLDLVWTVYG